METIIELIVQGLISLFQGKYQKNAPPQQRPGPPQIPPYMQQQTQPNQQSRPNRQGQLQRSQPARQGPKRRVPVRPIPGQRRGIPPRLPAAAPVPRVAATPHIAPAAPVRPVAPAAAPSQPAISAEGIRQLMLTRKSALRSIYVLSEVIGPPLALRDSDRSL
jgi:hypothetical protein